MANFVNIRLSESLLTEYLVQFGTKKIPKRINESGLYNLD